MPQNLNVLLTRNQQIAKYLQLLITCTIVSTSLQQQWQYGLLLIFHVKKSHLNVFLICLFDICSK